MASPKGQIKIVDSPGGNTGGGGDSAIGAVIVADYSTFSYYVVTSSTLGTSENGYNIYSNAKDVAFSVTLTNREENHRTLTLNSNSQLFFVKTINPNNVGYLIFYIVDVDSNGKILPTLSNPIDLVYNVPKTVYFASAEAITGSTDFTAQDLVTTGNSPDEGVYPLNLALLGSFDDGAFAGQNIPFVSVYVNS